MVRSLVTVAVIILAVGWWRGWFTVTNHGKVDVQVDETKFRQDKEEFGRKLDEKSRAFRIKVAELWKHSEGLTGDEKVSAQKELASLETQQARLERQIRDLENADPYRFESIKRDLSDTLAEVEKKIEELTRRLESGKGA